MYDGSQEADGRTTPQEEDGDGDGDDDDEKAEELEVLTDLQHHHAKHRRGKLVTFYRNGDPHFRGLRTSVSKKMFATLGTLLAWLNEKISTEHGVKYVFSLPDGSAMRDIAQFVGGRSYVVSSVRRIIHVPYGDTNERFWNNRSAEKSTPDPNQQSTPQSRQSWQPTDKASAPYTDRGRGPYTTRENLNLANEKGSPWLLNDESSSSPLIRNRNRRPSDDESNTSRSHYPPLPLPTHRPALPSIPQSTPPLSWAPATPSDNDGSKEAQSPISSRHGDAFQRRPQPRILVIRSNTDRSSRQKVIFNPYTSQSYEDVLVDVGNMVDMKYPPVTALYTAMPPFIKVMGLSHLARDLKNCDEFLACGREAAPMERQSGIDSSAARRSRDSSSRAPPPPPGADRDSTWSSQSLDRLDSGAESNGGGYPRGGDDSRISKSFRAASKPTRNDAKPTKKSLQDSDGKRVNIQGQMRGRSHPTSNHQFY